ncbi:DUF1653 domain-containing protein [Anaerostipes rhamnosivorans]|uniref:DUF1653 domain-containing protein n=1 Tax=Anaerostipes rhamnosivorans TaxID=1229621 RepID=A0A4P8IDH4_9FIRM|nr:DUF1653 domain-containing protein [Anaerostipes rhamnosivorans]QCP35872.1 protein of unknown function DUF1653 [Anaerostipes rhamnosivorans]
MEQRAIPRPGDFYKHFKDKLYQIVTVAEHSETGEALVIYQALYGDYKTYARPLPMFLSQVDREKYPGVSAKYRFERVDVKTYQNITDLHQINDILERHIERKEPEIQKEHPKPEKKEPKPEEHTHEKEQQDLLIRFLDAESNEERLELLRRYEDRISETVLDSIGLSMDFPLNSEDRGRKLRELEGFIKTKMKYEKKRR